MSATNSSRKNGVNHRGGSIFSISFWNSARVTGSTYTASSTPLVGNEANLMALFRLNSNVLDSVRYA
jgi:hypothetical protein